ncbi:MAG: cardiolipin hydrolase [Flavobacteriales bacterium]
MKRNKALEQWLRLSIEDFKIDAAEKAELRVINTTLDPEARRYLRNRAFDLVREEFSVGIEPHETLALLRWLEKVLKLLSVKEQEPSQVFFSPGKACREKIIALCNSSNICIDVCVFTIADDLISKALVQAHRRGVVLRIVTDDDKQHDMGPDIHEFKCQGIPVATDIGAAHMHHKFAVFDKRFLLNGSFNWTRSASERNFENVTVTSDVNQLGVFQKEFDRLWNRFSV